MGTEARELSEVPAYGIRQAAHYTSLPFATVRSWVGSEGVIQPPVRGTLSFNNLAELHVLKAMRRTHKLTLQSIRKALRELERLRQTAHPLLDASFGTDGIDLCLLEEERVVNLNKSSQQEIKEVTSLFLQRIGRDSDGRAAWLNPFVAREQADEPRHISINPTVAFGRPVLAGTGIATAVVAGRFAARDTVEDLAREYEVAAEVLEDAIRWEMLKGKAA